MEKMKHTPVKIWCAPEGEYGQGFDAVRLCTWSERQEYRDGLETQYVRADIADKVLDALRELADALDDGLCNSGTPDFDSGRLDRALTIARDAIVKAT